MENCKASIQKLNSNPVRAKKKERVFSNDPSMICQTFCCLCDKVVPMSSMKSHVKTWHKMTIKEYKDLFGHPKKQILHSVYHTCALCKTTVLFDPDEMYKHLKRKHQISYKVYSTQYLGQQQERISTSQPKNRGKNKDLSLVVIRCDQCDKTFTQNIQLNFHKKKHSSKTLPSYWILFVLLNHNKLFWFNL